MLCDASQSSIRVPQGSALNMLPVTGGIEILSRSDAPPGSGLGEAAALDVALLTGLARGRMEEYDADDLVELGIMLDRSELGSSGCRQDHVASVSGGFHELRLEGETIERRTLAVNEDLAEDMVAHLVLAYTGQTHFSTQTYRRVWEAYQAGESRVVDALRSKRDLARDVGPILEQGEWQALAGLVDKDWEYQQKLDTAMTTPHTRSIEAAMRDAGSWGVTGIGEGAGGCLLAICPRDRKQAVHAAASAHGASTLDLHFAFDGVALIERDDAADNV